MLSYNYAIQLTNHWVTLYATLGDYALWHIYYTHLIYDIRVILYLYKLIDYNYINDQ